MQPMRARLVASAIAACSAQPSYTGPPGPLGPIVARWSKSQRWSNPPSSPIFQIARSWSIVIHWPEALSPKRSGCVIDSPLVKAQLADADGMRVLLREHLRRPAEALDLVAVLANVPGNLVGRRLRANDLRLARDADHHVAGLVGVEVQLDVGIGAHMAGLDAGCRVDEERVPVPQKPHGHRLRLAVGTRGDKPDHLLLLQPRLNLSAWHNYQVRRRSTPSGFRCCSGRRVAVPAARPVRSPPHSCRRWACPRQTCGSRTQGSAG